MRLFITGSDGFLGYRLSKYFTDKYEVDVSTFHLMKGLMEDLYPDGPSINLKDGDFVNLRMDTAQIRKYGIAFHNTRDELAASLMQK